MYLEKIDDLVKQNSFFRKVVFTGLHSQLVMMSIPVGEDIGEETHQNLDQLFYIIDGEAKAVLDGNENILAEGDAVLVPAGTRHNIINTDNEELKLFTVYSPPAHPDGTIQKTKSN